MWNPEDYAQHSNAQLKWARELRKHLDLKPDAAILDVGCGDGKITADLALTVPQGTIVGLDNSPQMVAYAQRTYPLSQYPNLSFVCGDARALPWTQTFDVVFSNATLHWVDNHQVFLQGAYGSLRDGGQLAISCGGQGNAAEIFYVFAEAIAQAPWRPYFETFQTPYFFYGTSDYRQWLQETGFTIERLALVPKDMTQMGKAGLAAWIRTTWMPFTHCVPEPKRDFFIAQFVESYLERFPLDARGLAHVHMVRLEVIACKSPVNNALGGT